MQPKRPPRSLIAIDDRSMLVRGGIGAAALPPGAEWFPARIVAAVTGGYTFVETVVDDAGAVTDKDNGRTNTSSDPAVPVDGATLAADDVCLCRVAPAAVGYYWELAPMGGGGGALSSGQEVYATTYAITSDDTYEATGFTVSLPSAGTYLVAMHIDGQVIPGTLTTGTEAAALRAKVYDNTASVDLEAETAGVVVAGPVAGMRCSGTLSTSFVYEVTGATELEVQANADTASSDVDYTGGLRLVGGCVITWVKLG